LVKLFNIDIIDNDFIPKIEEGQLKLDGFGVARFSIPDKEEDRSRNYRQQHQPK